MVILAFVWIALTIADLAGYSPRWVQVAEDVVWGIFVVDFIGRFLLAPVKRKFLERNWITLLALLLPALRVFRIFRIVRAARGVRLFRILSSTNRTTRALVRSLGRKGFAYVATLTVIVTFAGAAGMMVLENGLFHGYGDALWWTAMIMTTMGSEAWPKTPGGRTLCFVLALYAFSVFGYVTAALASFLVERGPANDDPPVDVADEIVRLRKEVAQLSERIGTLCARPGAER